MVWRENEGSRVRREQQELKWPKGIITALAGKKSPQWHSKAVKFAKGAVM